MKPSSVALIITLTFCFCATTAKVVWHMKPEEVIALQGNMVMLNCFADGRNITNPSEHKFWWYRVDRNIIISKNLVITTTEPGSERYSVLLDKYRGVYSLVIRNVSKGEGGLYQCLLKQSKSTQQEASDNASLTVLTPPRKGYAPCTVYRESNIILSPSGDRALKCPKQPDTFWSIPRGNTPVNETVYHSWAAANRQVLHAFFLQNKTTLLSESTTGNAQDTAYCAVNSSMLNQSPENCRLIPRATSTTALISPPLIDVLKNATINFTCSHQDVAVAVDYTWDIPTELMVGGVKFIRNGETIILENIRGKWGKLQNIVCQVTTEWGVKANATATIAFLHKLVTKPAEEDILNTTQVEPAVVGPNLPNESQKPDTVPSRSETKSPALKNISILVGPALGVIILFLLAVIFALCITKQKTSPKHQVKVTHQLSSLTDPQKAVTLRSPNKTTNRNSRTSRRFSDSFTYRFSRDCEYENIEAYMAKKGQFIGGTTSFQDENNSPMEANVRVKIEMPSSLSTSMPALNGCKITSNINGHAMMEDQRHHPHQQQQQQQQQHQSQDLYSNHPSLSGHIYKPLPNGNHYATREQYGFPTLISSQIREPEHYRTPSTNIHHAVIDKPKKAMKPPNPPPRKPSY